MENNDIIKKLKEDKDSLIKELNKLRTLILEKEESIYSIEKVINFYSNQNTIPFETFTHSSIIPFKMGSSPNTVLETGTWKDKVIHFIKLSEGKPLRTKEIIALIKPHVELDGQDLARRVRHTLWTIKQENPDIGFEGGEYFLKQKNEKVHAENMDSKN